MSIFYFSFKAVNIKPAKCLLSPIVYEQQKEAEAKNIVLLIEWSVRFIFVKVINIRLPSLKTR